MDDKVYMFGFDEINLLRYGNNNTGHANTKAKIKE